MLSRGQKILKLLHSNEREQNDINSEDEANGTVSKNSLTTCDLNNIPIIFDDDLFQNSQDTGINKENLPEDTVLMKNLNYNSLLETSDADSSQNNNIILLSTDENYYLDNTSDNNLVHQDCLLSIIEQPNILTCTNDNTKTDIFPKTYINDNFLQQDCLLETIEPATCSNTNTKTDVFFRRWIGNLYHTKILQTMIQI